MTVVYDAGVLIAAERNERRVWADHRARLGLGLVPITTAPVVAQVSRDARQAQLHRFLRGCDIVGFGAGQAHGVGALLAAADADDVVDAHVVVVAAAARADVLSSDVADLAALAAKIESPVRVAAV